MNGHKKNPEVTSGILSAGTGNLYQNLFENSKSIMLLIDPLTSCIADVNKAGIEFYGYEKEKLLSMKISDINILSPEELSIELENAGSHGVNYFNFKHKLSSGEIKSVEVYTNPIELDGREYLFSIIHDISEKKELEEKLIKSEEKYRQIFESSMDGILLTIPNGEILYANPAAINILGWTQDEIKTLSCEDIFDFADSYNRQLHEERKRTGKFLGEVKFNRKDGTVFTVEMSSRIFTLKDGSQRTSIIFRDITEKKRTQELLSDTIEFNGKIYNSLFVGNAVYDSSGQCISANEKFGEMIGATKEQVLSQNFNLLDSWKSYGLFVIANEVLKSGTHIQKYIFMITTFGRNVWLDFNAVRFFSKGEPHLLVMIEDITERKKNQIQQLQLLKDKQLALDAAHLGWWHFDPLTKIINWDDRFKEIFELSNSMGSSEEIYARIYPEDLSLVKMTFEDTIISKDQKPKFAEYRIRLDDGAIRWIEGYGISVLVGTGINEHIVSSAGTVQDITLRKKAENTIRESDYKMQSIFHSVPIGMGLTTNGTFIIVNDILCKMTGYSKDELQGKSARILYVSESEFQLAGMKLFNEITENQSVKIELKCRRKDGTVFDALIGFSMTGFNDSVTSLTFSVIDISERKKTENILAESQAYLNSVINSTQDLIWSVDSSEYSLMKSNSAFDKLILQLTGHDIYEGIHLVDLFSAENVLTWKEYFNNTFKNNNFITEFYSPEIDKTFSLSFNTLKRDDKIFGISVFGRDITEIKKHENQIRELAEDLQKAQKVSHVGSWKWFIQTNKLEWSDEMYQIFGINKSDFSGNLPNIITSSIHPDDLETVNASNMSVIKYGNPIPLEYRIVLPDKSIRTVWAEAGELIYDKDKQPYLLTGIVQDITEQKKIEAELRTSNERYSKLVGTIPDVIVRSDLKGNITFVSEAIIQNWGYKDKQKFINKNVFSFVAEKDKLRAQNNMTRIFNEHLGLQEYELSIDGNEFEVEIHAEVLLDYERKPYGLVFVIRDVSRRKKIERELEEYRLNLEKLVKKRTQAYEDVFKRLEEEIVKVKEAEEKERLALEKEKELSEMKSKFISITSHEFRTPLTTLLSSVEILEMAGNNYDENKRNAHYQKIKNNIEFLVKMIDELLYLNRVDSNRINVAYLKTNLSVYCKEIFGSIKEQYKEIEAFIDFKLEKSDFNIDRSIIQKILSNLLVNAFKFNKPNGKVSFVIYSESNRLFFKISDTGIGIPEDEQNNVFEPFGRMSNSQHIKGTGLGLNIVKKSVEQLGGSITFTSNKNGTEFIVEIPYN